MVGFETALERVHLRLETISLLCKNTTKVVNSQQQHMNAFKSLVLQMRDDNGQR
jgi:hypothetical protein